MKRTTGILVCTLAAGMAWAQSPEIIQNTRAKMDTVQQNKTAASNEALGVKQPAAKDSHAKPTATPVKSSAAVVKTSAAPAKASVAQTKVSVAPTKVSVAQTKVSVAPTKLSVAPTKASVAPAKASVAPAKANAAAPKPKVAAASPTSKSAVPFAPKPAASASPASKIAVKQIPAKKEAKPVAAHQKVSAAPKKAAAPTTKNSPQAAASSTTGDAASAEEKASDDDAVKDAQDKKWSMSGKRDPFISPVVSHSGGSGCSTGKKCLEIGAINLRGVVHSDAGFIAVVTNSLNKAYFLRENDPVFDGYVVKITGDSVIFKETMQDRLGKTFTRARSGEKDYDTGRVGQVSEIEEI